jgi:hypothetical protein
MKKRPFFSINMRKYSHLLGWLLLLLPNLGQARGQDEFTFEIPKLDRPPELADFVGLPGGDGSQLAKVEGFIQREPSDGKPATQQTEVYAGYDDANLYVVFVAFDSQPDLIRARMTPRENISGDDQVTLMLDTFHDQRRAFVFRTNPFGVQWDALWTEGQGFDASFDTVWDSDGILTEYGYLVRMAIPFKSLRFPPERKQTWGILFSRAIPRGQAEESYWPAVSSRIEGRLNQAATLTGIANVSPSRNTQIIPYATYRGFKAIDPGASGGPDHVTDLTDAAAGVDAKLVFKDFLVTDVTVNPDFSQVESDEPQVTVNQRFEVFFPERRPFFLENADFFRTPIHLVFTRRIADPRLGARVTGKTGPYAIGALLIDDRSPGKLAPVATPLHGTKALFGIARVNRDLGEQSTLGAIYVGRKYQGSFNRVGGVDGRFRFGDHWSTSFQAVSSSTRELDGTEIAGPAYEISWNRVGRQFNYFGRYIDISEDFRAEAGFVPRTDFREMVHFTSYFFRPEATLIFWGPEFLVRRSWDQNGTRLDDVVEASLEWTFTGQTSFEVNYRRAKERLRPEDFPVLKADKDFDAGFWAIEYGTAFTDAFNLEGDLSWGSRINFDPLPGEEPYNVDWIESALNLNLRPMTRLRIDNTYLYTQLSHPVSNARVLSDHILRTRWNYQFNRELSLRMILQYEATSSNRELTSAPTRKNVNGDVLLTYRVNPWTALYVGFNTNAQNLELLTEPRGERFLRRGNRLINDANQVFFKLSYLLRF